jgi:GntR family transcriptional regulator
MLQIDLASETPAYEQIARGLRALLVAARLKPGDQLPTVRQLALDLGVHHNTVAEAYRKLAGEGWLELKRGRGATVRERSSPLPAPAARQQFARRLEELLAKAVSDGLPRKQLAGELLDSVARLRKGVAG